MSTDYTRKARHEFARLGGFARAKKLTKAQRVAAAYVAAMARWHPETKKAKAR